MDIFWNSPIPDIITCCASFLKSDWLVCVLFLFKIAGKKWNRGQKSEIAGKN